MGFRKKSYEARNTCQHDVGAFKIDPHYKNHSVSLLFVILCLHPVITVNEYISVATLQGGWRRIK
jgi:hypothetical protein